MQWVMTQISGFRCRVRALGAVCVLALVGVMCGACTMQQPAEPSGTVVGKGAVTLFAVDQRGEPLVIAGVDGSGNSVSTGDWVGDPVVVNLWYAACGPCRAEAPDLVALAQDHAGNGVKFLGLNTRDNAETAAAFERSFAVEYPSILDSDGRVVAGLVGQVSAQAVPTTLVLDRKGRVAARVLGRVEKSTLNALISDVVQEPK